MRTCVTILRGEFFSRSVLKVAPDLLGKYLVSANLEAIITEVEAYDGPQDLACHGRFGPTKRTEVMFGPAGYFYVYLCYGVHWMLNIVTGNEGYPAAVLIRGVRGSKGLKGSKGEDTFHGPGKITKAFGIDQSFNGKSVEPSSGLWIEDRGVEVHSNQMRKLPRIGVDYAGAWAKKPYRFLLRD